LDKATLSKVEGTLKKLEKRLLVRIPRAVKRSPDTLLDKITALNTVLELKSRLRLSD